jgi:hypothetical protein
MRTAMNELDCSAKLRRWESGRSVTHRVRIIPIIEHRVQIEQVRLLRFNPKIGALATPVADCANEKRTKSYQERADTTAPSLPLVSYPNSVLCHPTHSRTEQLSRESSRDYNLPTVIKLLPTFPGKTTLIE